MPTDKHNRGYARLPECVRRLTFASLTQEDIALLHSTLSRGRYNPIVADSLRRLGGVA